MRTAFARCSQGSAAAMAAALSPVPFQAQQTRVPMVAGTSRGAISTGRPESNSTACSASGGGNILSRLRMRHHRHVIEAGLLRDDVLLAPCDGL